MIRVRWRFYEESLLIVTLCVRTCMCMCTCVFVYVHVCAYVLCVRMHPYVICVTYVYLYQWDPIYPDPKDRNTRPTKQLWCVHKFVKPGHLAERTLALIL